MSREFRYIIRVANIDLDGTQGVAYALTRIKGINLRLADAILKRVGIKPETRLGLLSENDVEKIEEAMQNLNSQGLPSWFLNRRKDIETGKDLHRIGSDLVLQIKNDIDRMKAVKSWRGYRHAHGLKVRGQRTRTTGRTGKTVGVRKRRRGAR